MRCDDTHVRHLHIHTLGDGGGGKGPCERMYINITGELMRGFMLNFMSQQPGHLECYFA